jgi:glyoxylase-like metal-dependent hydrolase (beta-lactamase superfamily II)
MIERMTVGPIGENVYVLPFDSKTSLDEEGSPCLLVDPGDEAERIAAFLESRRLDLRCVVLTHGHLDHTAALPALYAAWGARGAVLPPLAVHKDDLRYLGPEAEAANRETFTAIRAIGFFRHYSAPMPPADLVLDDGDFVAGSSWRVLHSPGHTAGSICLYEADLGVLVSGDTLFRDGVGRTDGPDSSARALEKSISGRLFSLPAGTLVYPGHGEPTTIGRERDGAIE